MPPWRILLGYYLVNGYYWGIILVPLPWNQISATHLKIGWSVPSSSPFSLPLSPSPSLSPPPSPSLSIYIPLSPSHTLTLLSLSLLSLSLSLSLSLCFSLSSPVCLCIFVSVCLSVCLSVSISSLSFIPISELCVHILFVVVYTYSSVPQVSRAPTGQGPLCI